MDSGRELMVPWRLAHGERLYRDLQFHHGPLGPYLAAIVDGLAGPSLPARVALCALVALLHVAALGRIARRFLSPARAALATSLAVAVAVFLQPGGWLFPFSFDVALAVAALTASLALAGHNGDARPRTDALAGLGVLAALLARPELGLAGAAILAFAARRRPRRLVSLFLAPLAAAASGYALLSLDVPRRALVEDGWLRVLSPTPAIESVYGAYAGLDRIGLRLAELGLAAIVLLLFGVLLASASWIASRLEASGHRAPARAVELAAVAILAAAAILRARPPAGLAETLGLLPPLIRVVPPLLLAAAALRLVRSLRDRPPSGALAAVPDAVLWTAAAFGARLLLAAGYVGTYDAFFLPLPLLVAAAGVFRLADRFASGLGGGLPRLATAALAVFLLFRLAALTEFFRGRATPWSLVATPAGNLRLREPVASVTAATLDALSRLPPQASLAGFPETGFFNYVLRRRNPFRLEQFFPGRLDAEGETRAIAVLAASPPDVLLRANVLAVGEGARVFGRDYLERLDAAARERYRTIAIFGPGAGPESRIGDPQFFVEMTVPAERAAADAP